MYAIGENFEYLIDDEELDISVIGDIMLFGDEYLIGEDLEGQKYVFIYREDEEIVELIEDEDEISDILDSWEDEYFAGGTDIGDWEDDSYYEREDSLIVSEDADLEEYFEIDDYSESEEDLDSFISGLMGG
ncbi:MAG: hypothetical protein DSY38_04865 [Fusobacteria bacterium]|nr:MAG: hypothetical protein DSY38_04865 [Fusobacteriota bacterium]